MLSPEIIRLQLNSNTEKKKQKNKNKNKKINIVVQGGSFQRKGALTFLTENMKHICETKL